jgi:hypothetical protein
LRRIDRDEDPSAPVVTLLTDYGLVDEFVGVCHGVIASIAPRARIIDISHGIAPQHVLHGALVLADSLAYMPIGIHLAVVDPDVGGNRRAVVLRGVDGRLYVGPDNGLLIPAVERFGGAAEAFEITDRTYMLDPVSPTFHGRDVFAPVAAHLANGVPAGEVGARVDPADLVRVELPAARVEEGHVQTTVLIVDRFGNVRLNVSPGQLEEAGIRPGDRVDIEVDSRHFSGLYARTFTDVGRGALLLFEDASQSIAVAVNSGSAARLLTVLAGQGVGLSRGT